MWVTWVRSFDRVLTEFLVLLFAETHQLFQLLFKTLKKKLSAFLVCESPKYVKITAKLAKIPMVCS